MPNRGLTAKPVCVTKTPGLKSILTGEREVTNAERQASFKNRQTQAGLVQLNVWVPANAEPETRAAIARLCADRDLRIARLMSVKTGRLTGLAGRVFPHGVTAHQNDEPKPRANSNRDEIG